jgi:pSer/pThr/pTyr-binding forkhead associated (FHA) protein
MSSLPSPSLIFVSHSHEDSDFSSDLVASLRARLGQQTQVWHDISGGLTGGESLWRTIISQISACDVFLLVMSPAALRSSAVRFELDMALVRRLQGKTQIIPVLYHHCDVPLELMILQYVSFLPPKSHDQAFADLITAIDALPRSSSPSTAVLPLEDRLGLIALGPPSSNPGADPPTAPLAQQHVMPTALVLSIAAAAPPRLVELPGDSVTVGRGENNDLVLPDPAVSRHHLHLQRHGSRWRVHRLPEAAALYVNGRARDDAELVSGDQVVAGGTALRFDLPTPLAGDPSASAASAAPTVHTSMMPSQLIVDSADCHFVVPLRASLMTIGRAPDSAIVIPSPAVSVHHALLRQDAQAGYVIEDAGGRHGLYLNGQRVPRHTFRSGDAVLIAPDIPGHSVTLAYSALR